MTTLKRTPQEVRPAGEERRRLLIQDRFDFKRSHFHALGQPTSAENKKCGSWDGKA
jgi:hypothetical protein